MNQANCSPPNPPSNQRFRGGLVVTIVLLFVSAVIFCSINPAPMLQAYKFLYVKYMRVTKADFTKRFTHAELYAAIAHARGQAWVQDQIAADLAPFKGGISHAQLATDFKIMQHSTANKLAKFTVTDKVVTVDVPAEFLELRSYKTVYAVVNLLAGRGLIPNCEFIVALNDYLAYIPENITQPVPIFTFAKHTKVPVEQTAILIPDWMNLRYWDILRGRISLANKLYPWESKKVLIHWRGGCADSMLHRTKLVQLKHKYDFLDVGMTEGNDKVAFMDPEQSIQYKYQISLDGARCTWERMIWQMASNTVMIKPYSPQVQWFHRGLQPYKNYVPIADIDADSIHKVYTWLQQHDQEAKAIVQHANEFAQENFKTQDFFAYYAVLLQQYAKLLSPALKSER